MHAYGISQVSSYIICVVIQYTLQYYSGVDTSPILELVLNSPYGGTYRHTLTAVANIGVGE